MMMKVSPVNPPGFQVNSDVIQEIVGRYADANYAIDFDCFIGCLIRVEMLFSECSLVSLVAVVQ